MDNDDVMHKQFGIPQFDAFRASNGTFREAAKIRDQLVNILDALHTVAQLQQDRTLINTLQSQFDWIITEKTKYEDYAYFYFKVNHFPHCTYVPPTNTMSHMRSRFFNQPSHPDPSLEYNDMHPVNIRTTETTSPGLSDHSGQNIPEVEEALSIRSEQPTHIHNPAREQNRQKPNSASSGQLPRPLPQLVPRRSYDTIRAVPNRVSQSERDLRSKHISHRQPNYDKETNEKISKYYPKDTKTNSPYLSTSNHGNRIEHTYPNIEHEAKDMIEDKFLQTSIENKEVMRENDAESCDEKEITTDTSSGIVRMSKMTPGLSNDKEKYPTNMAQDPYYIMADPNTKRGNHELKLSNTTNHEHVKKEKDNEQHNVDTTKNKTGNTSLRGAIIGLISHISQPFTNNNVAQTSINLESSNISLPYGQESTKTNHSNNSNNNNHNVDAEDTGVMSSRESNFNEKNSFKYNNPIHARQTVVLNAKRTAAYKDSPYLQPSSDYQPFPADDNLQVLKSDSLHSESPMTNDTERVKEKGLLNFIARSNNSIEAESSSQPLTNISNSVGNGVPKDQEKNESQNVAAANNPKSSFNNNNNESFASITKKQPNQNAKAKKFLNVIEPASMHPFWAGPSNIATSNISSVSNAPGATSFNSSPGYVNHNGEGSITGGEPNYNIKNMLQPRLTTETLDSIFPGTFVKNLPTTSEGIKLQYMTEVQSHIIPDLVDNNHNPLSNMCHVIASAAGSGKTTMALMLALFDLYSHEKRVKTHESRLHRHHTKVQMNNSNNENQRCHDNERKNNGLTATDLELLKAMSNPVYIFIMVPLSSRIDGLVTWLERAHSVCNFRVHAASRKRSFPELQRLQKGQHIFIGTSDNFVAILDSDSQAQILPHLHCLIMLQAETLFSLRHTSFTTVLQLVLNTHHTPMDVLSVSSSHTQLNQFGAKILMFSNTWNDALDRDLRKIVGEEGRMEPVIKNYCRQQFMHWYIECDNQAGKFVCLHQLCNSNPYEKALIFVKFFNKAQSLQSVLDQNEVVLYDCDPQQDMDKILSQVRMGKVKGLLCADGQRGLHELWKLECNVIINYDLCAPHVYMKRASSCGIENEPIHIITFLAKNNKENCEYRSMLKHLKVEGNLLVLDKKATPMQST